MGKYDIEARLGGDVMGTVYLGRSPRGDAFVVRVIDPALTRDRAFLERLEESVAAAGAITGPFVETPVDAEIWGEVVWIATRRPPGLSLAEAVTRFGPLPERSLLLLGAALAGALGAVHATGLVLGGLDPQRVHLAPDGPRVVDVAIGAAAAGSALPALTAPWHQAPEVLRGAAPDAAAGVFSLGTVLAFAANTAARPRTSEDDMHGRLLPALPGSIRPIVGRCLATEPGDRPTAEEVRAELAGLAGVDDRPDAFPAGDWLPFASALRFEGRPRVPRPLPRRAVLGTAVASLSGLGLWGAWRLIAGGGPEPVAGEPPPGPRTAPADFLHVTPFPTASPAELTRELRTRPVPPAHAFLTGPHFELRVASVLVTTELDAVAARRLSLVDAFRGIRATDGHEFVIVVFDMTGDRPWRQYPAPPLTNVTITVTAAGREYPVPDMLEKTAHRDFFGGNVTRYPPPLVVSVPRGADAVLEILEEGRTQSLDLRTGRRGNDAVAGYYDGLSTMTFPFAGPVDNYDATLRVSALGRTRPVRLQADFRDAWFAVGPWAPAVGWAAPGRAWLVLRIRALLQLADLGTDVGRALREDLMEGKRSFFLTGGLVESRSFTLESDSGSHRPLDPGPSGMWPAPLPAYTMVFDIPQDWRSGTLVFHPEVPLGADTRTGPVPVTWSGGFPDHRLPLVTRPAARR